MTGNLKTSYYGLEGRNTDGSDDRRNLFYESVSLRSSDFGVRALSFSTNFRFRGDASGDP